MTQHTFTRVGLLLGLGAALLTTSVGASAQDTGQVEGIHVQGDWVIEVRDPDGSLVDRREFSNDLVAPSKISLALVGERVLVVRGVALDTECSTPTPTLFTDPTFTCVSDLNRSSAPQTGPDAGAIVVEESTTIALSSGTTDQITQVATVAWPCSASDTGVDCAVSQNVDTANGETPIPFTATTLATPVDVAEGQTVIVRVVITFN